MPTLQLRLLIAILLLAPAIVSLSACGSGRLLTVNIPAAERHALAAPPQPLVAAIDPQLPASTTSWRYRLTLPRQKATGVEQWLNPVLHQQPRPDVLLLGEQHDSPYHHRLERETVAYLIQQGRLGALALEMAERGRSTAGLGVEASEEQVRGALGWNDGAWPWSNYGPTVMLAVREAIPVLGANLPRNQQRDAMRNEALDGVLTADNLQKQMHAIVEGHCGLLVANQVLPMARIQIARDRAMAQTLTDAARRMPTTYEDRALGKPLVLLLAGRAHVDRLLGVPAHLPTDIKARAIAMVGQTTETAATRNADSLDAIWPTEPAPAKDYCAEFRNTRPPNATTNVTP